MRVISGSLKGRQLKSPGWDGLRPSADRLRETLFNVVSPRIAGGRMLDGYAGTGAVGIEALSRGAAHVTFVEREPRALALIAENLGRCGVESGYTILRSTVERSAGLLTRDRAFAPFDFIFLDPPYNQPPGGVLAEMDALLAPDGLLVLEHARRQVSPDTAGRLVRSRLLTSGDSALAFYTCQL